MHCKPDGRVGCWLAITASRASRAIAAGRGTTPYPRASCPLIRPSATFSRVGEKGHDLVTSPEAGRGRPGPARGDRAGEGCARGDRAGEGCATLLTRPRLRSPLIRPSATFSRVGEKGHELVTSPEAGRGRPGPARGDRAGEGCARGDRAGEGCARGDRAFERPAQRGPGGEGFARGDREGEGPARGDRAGEGPLAGTGWVRVADLGEGDGANYFRSRPRSAVADSSEKRFQT